MVLRVLYEHRLNNCNFFKEYIVSSYIFTCVSLFRNFQHSCFYVLATVYVATQPVLMIRKLAPPLLPVTLIRQQQTTGEDGSMQTLFIWPPLGHNARAHSLHVHCSLQSADFTVAGLSILQAASFGGMLHIV
jgi:hypothetical protein